LSNVANDLFGDDGAVFSLHTEAGSQWISLDPIAAQFSLHFALYFIERDASNIVRRFHFLRR
jgi:hypothetical protein